MTCSAFLVRELSLRELSWTGFPGDDALEMRLCGEEDVSLGEQGIQGERFVEGQKEGSL